MHPTGLLLPILKYASQECFHKSMEVIESWKKISRSWQNKFSNYLQCWGRNGKKNPHRKPGIIFDGEKLNFGPCILVLFPANGT